jgi:hypothetical protein
MKVEVSNRVRTKIWSEDKLIGSPLPLQMEECDCWIDNKLGALKLLGFFDRSMRWADWDERHPGFDPFCCGVMEDWRRPMDLRMDPELLQMFPPKKLAGFATPLHWRQPMTGA